MAVAVILILVAVGSVLFHVLSPWWWTPIASVILFMAYCVFRFRHREGRRAAYEPESARLEWWLTVVTAVGVAAMLAPGLFVWQRFVTVPDGASEFEVVGQQWLWSFRLPGKDGRLGTAETANVSPDNPLGLNPDDPYGQDDVIIQGDDLHLPVGKPLKVLLRSVDVLHDFYVPEFRAKMDMVPGMVTYFWFTPTRTGTYEILCFELCGLGHPEMRGIVVVDEQSDYQAWLDSQATFAQLASTGRPTRRAEANLGQDKIRTPGE